MRNQRLGATRMRNQRFGIYIQMSTLIQKFSLRNFSDFRVFPNLQLRIFKKIKNDFFLNFLNLYQVETTFGAWYIQRYNQTLQRTSSIAANPQLSGPIRNIYTFYFRNGQKRIQSWRFLLHSTNHLFFTVRIRTSHSNSILLHFVDWFFRALPSGI